MRYWQSILELIENSNEHLTAEQIFFRMKTNYPSIVGATVYNNLNSLCDQGKIRRVSLEGQPDRYDRITKHDHLYCVKCGKLMDIRLSDLTGTLEEQVGFRIESYDLRVHYICDECRLKD